MARTLLRSASAAARLTAAGEWLDGQVPGAPLLVLAATGDAADELLRAAAVRRGSVFGWHRATLLRLAGTLAAPGLAAKNLAPLGAFGVQALAARVVYALGDDALGHYAPVSRSPRFAAALARTIEELRLDACDLDALAEVDATAARCCRAYELELAAGRLADRATVLRFAEEAVRGDTAPSICGAPLLLLDLSLSSALEVRLATALVQRAPEVLATTPRGDERGARALARALGADCVTLDREPSLHGAAGADEPAVASSLQRLQQHLFEELTPEEAAVDEAVCLFSAPGESRECVEVARRMLEETQRGVPFDRMAILVRSMHEYRPHLEEALQRAEIPAHFATGATAPDPAGRAFIALLRCAAEGFSAARFAEYLSLGELPRSAEDGGPPPAPPASECWVPADDELIPELVVEAEQGEALDALEAQALDAAAGCPDPAAEPVVAGTLRTPHRWEWLLHEAAVIGGRERWARRLDGLAARLRLALERPAEPEQQHAERLQRQLAELQALRDFALPLLELLAGLPEQAPWAAWLDGLSTLALRGLRRPQRVLAALAELAPMAPVGPVSLSEVLLVLQPRLTEITERPSRRRYGMAYVAPAAAARGLAFDVVFVPGLAERLFPRRIVEDPILSDARRRALGAELATDEDRVLDERLALRLAVGAARRRIHLSYPRLDLQHVRPRVPSFYGLEVLRAASGRLPLFHELARQAELAGAARIGWPAPQHADEAVDEAEHDLALLEGLLRADPRQAAGIAAYLLASNPYLGRAIRFRKQRWGRDWTPADGLVDPSPAARAVLAEHTLAARSFSPTALQQLSACPYRFLLSAIQRLGPREVPEAVDELDALTRGSLVHEAQFMLHQQLAAAGLLPVRPANLDEALARMARCVDELAGEYADRLAPAIPRVWEAAVAGIRADLAEWLRRCAADDRGWVPWRFELAFGLGPARAEDPQDPHSVAEPVALPCGIQLRGKIDLVERNAAGQLRVTDHKTGRWTVKKGALVSGGQSLQPVLYGLAAERIFPEQAVVEGRLYYCTIAARFAERSVSIDERARRAAEVVARTVDDHLTRGFFPAAPAEGACGLCDFGVVCGPYEEFRTRRKAPAALAPLRELRGLP